MVDKWIEEKVRDFGVDVVDAIGDNIYEVLFLQLLLQRPLPPFMRSRQGFF